MQWLTFIDTAIAYNGSDEVGRIPKEQVRVQQTKQDFMKRKSESERLERKNTEN